MANLSQRASFMPATERAIPALLRKSLLYFWGKRRQALPVEHFEMQGWNIFGNPQPRDEEGDQQRQLRQALISLPPEVFSKYPQDDPQMFPCMFGVSLLP